MKLFKALVGLAAAASVIPLKVEKVEEDGKKTVRISSLTWKAEYTSATEEDDATLNVNLMGGLKELVKKKEKPAEEEESEESTESGESVDSEGSDSGEDEVISPDFDLADRISGGGIRWADLDDSVEEEAEEEELTSQDPQSIASQLASILEDMDDLFAYAIEYVVGLGKASTSMLQRKLLIGYGRASKIIDGMTKCRIVSYPNGSKPREVLISVDQWNEIKEQLNMTVEAPVNAFTEMESKNQTEDTTAE